MSLVSLFLMASALLFVQLAFGVTLKLLQPGVGLSWGIGSRDASIEPSVHAARSDRATQNMLETFPIFVGISALLLIGSSTSETALTGAMIYFFARALYFPVYIFIAVPMLRSVIWAASIAGLVMMGLGLI